MANYDIEHLLDDVEAFIKQGLPSKIDAINTEKSDAITLSYINTSAYAMQTTNNNVMVYDPFIVYGIDTVNATGEGAFTTEQWNLVVTIVAADQGTDIHITKRLLRYQRAIKELFQDAWASVGNASVKMKVQSMEPLAFRDMQTSHDFRAIGIAVQATLG